MTSDEYLRIGRLEASVQGLQAGQDKLFEKADEVSGKMDTLLGKIEEGWHTPTICPLATALAKVKTDVDDLKGFKKYVLGLAAGVTAAINAAIMVIKALLTKGGQ